MSLSSSAKSYMSHSYKIVSVTDQSENYKIANIESKNPATCWRTSRVCEQASFDIKFAPIKLHHIDIITQFSPQIEIKAYNKSDLGGIIDETQILPRVTIFNYKEVLEGQMHTKTKRYDFYDKQFLPNITFTHMKVTVSNPQHQEKAMCLGLNSFILFSRTDDSTLKASPALSFLEQRNKEVDEQLRRAVGFDRLQPSPSPSKLNTVNLAAEKDRRLSLFKYRDPVMTDSRDLHISNVTSSNSQRRNTIGLDAIVPGIKRSWDKSNQENINNLGFYDSINGQEKKIRPNYMNRDEQYRSNLGRPIGMRRPNDSSQDSFGSGDDELQRAIRESEKSYKKEKERWEQYDNEEIGTSKKVTGLRKINEAADERTQDMDDFQRAIRESKEMYLQDIDQPKLGMISSMDSQDEVNGKAYIEMLERVAEEEEDEIGEIPEDEKEESEVGEQEEMEMRLDDLLVKEKEEEEDDAGTEVLEDSMMKLWSTEDDETEVKNKSTDEMEIEERKESARGHEEGEVNPRIKLTFELGSQNSQGRRNRQLWGQPDTNHMISLVEKDFYNKYLHMETKARNDAERRKGGINRVEVVTSYENILSDVVFCLAGFEGDEKKSLKDLGISMGARYLDDIYANLTTHLVTNDTMTKRYKRAKKMKDITIVSTRWLIECYGQKKRLSEREFLVNLEDAL